MSVKGLTDKERCDRLRLARTENVGPVTFAHLMARYGTATEALKALPGLSQRGGRLKALQVPSVADAQAELEAGARLGAQLLFLGEAQFPRPLAALDGPPPLIWTLGHPALLNQPCVAVVGARIASAAGQRFARDLGLALGQAGLTVVSGLARGIDAAAHEGSLTSGTVAVLGGGIDDVYPPDNAGLYDRIVAQGCLVAEHPPGRKAQARDFPRRNRIIAGLSLGVVVVEAEMRSGSLITARLAGEQGREVFAVPGSPLDPRAKGSNDLLRQGATLCESAEDVLRVIKSLPSTAERERDLFDAAPVDQPALDAAVEALRETVAGLLSPTPIPRDALVRACNAPAPAVHAALVELALAGRAAFLPGGLVASAEQD
jgi:DNA processing protein